METTVKQRLITFINFLGISQAEFQRRCNMASGFINNINKSIGTKTLMKIESEFPQLNTRWLITGQGPMTTSAPGVVQNNLNGDNNYHSHNNVLPAPSAADEEATAEIQELQGAPVIPTALCREGGCDILEYIEENPDEVEISPIRAKGVTIDLWWRIRASDSSNAPTYMPGDNIALASYPKGEERPRPGRFYVVDTYSNGFELGILFPTDSGDFRMQKKNRDEFPDFTIERDDIIRIYRVIMMVRI